MQKNVVAKFVHDAVETEEAIYTLLTMEQQAILKKSDISQEDNSIIDTASNQHEQIRINLENCKKEYETAKKETVTAEFRWSVFFVALIAAGYLSIQLGIFMSYITDSVILPILTCPIIAIGGSWLLAKQDQKNHKQKEESTLNERKTAAEKNLKSAETAFSESLNNLNSVNQKHLELTQHIDLLASQIYEIQMKRTKLTNQLNELYNYGIIPPDYRTYDCVTILDQIFRNDLADTMRDAIKIYEERVFKGTVIRGMDRICSAIGNLSHGMEAMATRLEAINTNVTQMSNDLYHYNQDIIKESKKSRQDLEDLLKETQLGRYTNEKLLESSKTLEYYAEEYRLGRMPRDYMNQ